MARSAKKPAQGEATVPTTQEDAVSKFPKDSDQLLKIFTDLKAVQSEVRASAADVGEYKKRVEREFEMDKVVLAVAEKIVGLKQGRRECVVHQLRYLFDKLNLTPQGVLPGFEVGATPAKMPSIPGATKDDVPLPLPDPEEANDTDDGKVVPIASKKGGLSPKDALAKFSKATKEKEAKDAAKKAAQKAAVKKIADKYAPRTPVASDAIDVD